MVRIPLASEPEGIGIRVDVVKLSFDEPSLKRLRSAIRDASNPVFAVLRGLVFRDPEHAVLDVNPIDGRPTYLDRSKAGVEARPDERGDFPAVRALPIVGAYL